MSDQIYSALAPVRQRQRFLFALQCLGRGALVSAGVGLIWGLGRILAQWPTPIEGIITLLVAGPVVGFITGWFWPRSWQSAAAAVDTHARLKDRAISALDFLHKPSCPITELQLEETAGKLANIKPASIVPLRLPRLIPTGCVCLLVAAALLLWPLALSLKAEPLAPLPEVLAAAEEAKDKLKELEELVNEKPTPELEKLLKELKEKIEEMQQPGIDQKEAMAKLSEMQSALAEQQAQFNLEMVDAELKSLGEAMAVAQSLQNAAKALQQGKHEKAAEELAKIETPPKDREEKRTLKEKLKQVAEKLKQAKLKELAETVDELSECDSPESFCENCKKLGKGVKSHAQRKKLSQCMNSLCESLSECKCQCESNSTALGKANKSDSPSRSWGKATAGNYRGEATGLQSKRKEEQLSAHAENDGPAETEVTSSPEGKQQASRQYKEQYQKYKKMSDAVLDSEEIPLGHRQMIRKYFQGIRPDNKDETPVAKEEKKK